MLKEYHKNATLGNDANQIGTIIAAIKAGKIDDLTDEKKFGKNAIKTDEIEKIFQRAKTVNSEKEISRAFPSIAAKYVTSGKLAEEKKKNPKVNNRMKVIVSDMKQKDYENISKQDIQNDEFISAAVQFADGKSIEKLIEKHGNLAVKKLNDHVRSMSRKSQKTKNPITPEEYLKIANPKLYNYMKKSPGAVFFDIK